MVPHGQPMFSAQARLPLEPVLIVLQNSEEGVDSLGSEVTFILIDLLSHLYFTLKGDLTSGPDFTVQLLKLELFIYKMNMIPCSPACC